MENITIQVDPEIAKVYREAEPEKQQNVLLIFNLILKELFKDASFEEIVEQIRLQRQPWRNSETKSFQRKEPVPM